MAKKVVSGGEHTALLCHENDLYTFGCGAYGRLGHKQFEKLQVSYRESHAKQVTSVKWTGNIIDVACS